MKYIQYLSACLLIPVLFGCQRQEFDEVDGIGTPVKFAVATGYETGTRTEFSNDLTTGTSSTFERIDWVNGDIFRVNDGGSQSTDLTVSAHSASGQQSVATVTGTSLIWENASTTFYALYPSPATTGVTASLSTNTATGTIPSAQTVTLSGREYKADMAHIGYMSAAVTANAGSAVNLVFMPLMTAFRFELYANALSVPTAKLTSVTLTSASTSLAGNFTATLAANNTYTASVVGTGSNSVSANLGAGLNLNTSDPVVVTLLALPVAQTDLTLSLGFDDGKTRSIPLKQGNAFVTVPAGQKMYVNNLGVPGESGWRFTIDDIDPLEITGHTAYLPTDCHDLDFTVASYKYDILNPSTKVAVPWKVKYSADGVNWENNPADAGIGTKFALTQTTGNGSTTGEPNSAQILIPHGASDYQQGNTNDLAAARMAAATIPAELLDANGYYDLSKHAVYGSSYYGPETTQETANCYVISRPGKYKFPAVYGNAIRENADNERAFMPQGYHMVEGSPAVDHLNVNNTPMFMRRFLKHDDYWITTPNIMNQIGVTTGWANSQMRVIWQTGTTDILEETDLSKGANDNYIYFEVKPENIRPGNILIGLWYAPESFYVWSWHIWVTDEDLTPVAGNNYSMMKHNLGWINSATAQTQKWADWTFYVKIYQDVTGGAEEIFTVTQRGESTGGSTQEKGNSLLYQWGRKDPFPLDWGSSNYAMKHSHSIGWANTPTVSNEGAAQTTTNYNASIHGNIVTTNYAAAGMRAGHAIKNPCTLYKNTTTHHWVTGTDASGLMGNLWDGDYISGGTPNQNPLKSVYDPSPRGFVVASSPTYANFSTSSPSVVVTNEGWNLGTGSGSVTTFFPFAYGRNEGNTTFSDAYYWSATSDAYNDANYKYTSKVLKITGTTVGTSHHNKAEVMPVRSIAQTRF